MLRPITRLMSVLVLLGSLSIHAQDSRCELLNRIDLKEEDLVHKILMALVEDREFRWGENNKCTITASYNFLRPMDDAALYNRGLRAFDVSVSTKGKETKEELVFIKLDAQGRGVPAHRVVMLGYPYNLMNIIEDSCTGPKHKAQLERLQKCLDEEEARLTQKSSPKVYDGQRSPAKELKEEKAPKNSSASVSKQ